MEHNTEVSTSYIINKAIRGMSGDRNKIDLPSLQLKREIDKALRDVIEARQYFEFVDEPDLVDYAIYREKAAVTKFCYLIKKAKRQYE